MNTSTTSLFARHPVSLDTEKTVDRGGKRFAELLPSREWLDLPEAVRNRFDTDFCPGRTTTYLGTVTAARHSLTGWLLAQAARLIGAPLPLHTHRGPVTVTVTDHPGNRGQLWCRIYHRRRGFAQCVQSIKRFCGPTGLEEYLGAGLAVALTLSVEGRALTFTGREYAWYGAGRRWRLPGWLSPGTLRVTHQELAAERFEFTLALTHPIMGELIHQSMTFSSTGAGP